MTKSKRLSFLIDTHKTDRGHGNFEHFAFLRVHGENIGAMGYSEKGAKAKLLDKVEETLCCAVRAEARHQRRMIAGKTTEGEAFVLLVEWRSDCWGYSMWRAGSHGYSSCACPSKSGEAVVEMAREHARQMGTIEWEAGVVPPGTGR